MMIITNDGYLIQGSPATIVETLRQAQRLGSVQDNRTYMADVASRVRLWCGVRVPTQNEEVFLEGLRQCELVDILDM